MFLPSKRKRMLCPKRMGTASVWCSTLKCCSFPLPLKLTLTVMSPSHRQLSQIMLFHSFVSCVTCHGNKCVCRGSEDETINSIVLGPAFAGSTLNVTPERQLQHPNHLDLPRLREDETQCLQDGRLMKQKQYPRRGGGLLLRHRLAPKLLCGPLPHCPSF